MREWVYKATTKKADVDDTRILAMRDHFLCRSAYEPGGDGDGLRLVAKVADVKVGDMIHFYYRTVGGKAVALGSFIVEDPGAYPDRFVLCEGHGALVRVRETDANRRFLERLQRGYRPDRRLNVFTGWAIRKLPASHPTPTFHQTRMFPGARTNFWHYPDAELPRAKKKSERAG